MKMRNLKMAAIALIAVATLGACKKGENDPFLSLKSRNARITGVWHLTTGTSSSSDATTLAGVTTTDTQSTSYTETTMTQTDNGVSTTIPYTESMEIKKDGTYTRTTVSDGTTYTSTGNWWWENSKKKKVRIAFDDDWGSMYIDRLKNKELVLTYDESGSTSATGYTNTYSYTQSMTFEKE